MFKLYKWVLENIATQQTSDYIHFLKKGEKKGGSTKWWVFSFFAFKYKKSCNICSVWKTFPRFVENTLERINSVYKLVFAFAKVTQWCTLSLGTGVGTASLTLHKHTPLSWPMITGPQTAQAGHWEWEAPSPSPTGQCPPSLGCQQS